jgi:putative transposase
MTKGYQKENTSVHLMNYHFVWCPRYRRKLLVGEIKNRLLELINTKADILKCKVLTIEIMPDHTHLFIRGNPSLSANYIIGQIKGMTSKILRDEFSFLKKMPTLWTRSYFVSTAGNVSQFVIQKYIEEQYKHK